MVNPYNCNHKWEAAPSPNKRGEYPKTIVVYCDGCGLFTYLLMPPIENLEMEKS